MNKPITHISLSIIFPNLNGRKADLYDLLESIKDSSFLKKKLEVIMVDNGSSKTSLLDIKKSYPWLKVIELNSNYGFAKAVNIGVKTCRGSYIFVTNNDVILKYDCLKLLVNFLKHNPSVGIVGGRVYQAKTTKKILYSALKYNFYTGLFKTLPDVDNTQVTDWVPGSGLCCSKKLWLKLSGFDEDFFFTGEDLDFCLRTRKLGYKIIYFPQAIMWHQNGGTVNRKQFINFKYYYGYRGKFRLIFKHGNMFQIITSIILQFFFYTPYRLIILGEKSLIPLIRAFLWNIKYSLKIYE